MNDEDQKPILISLSREQYNQLVEELSSLFNYHWNSDRIHANDCGSKILSEIEEQGDGQIQS